MRTITATLAALLAACSLTPEHETRYLALTPADCREYGVEVDLDDTVTGRITFAKLTTNGGVRKLCMPPGDTGQFDRASYTIHGCARDAEWRQNERGAYFPSPTHEYVVVAAGDHLGGFLSCSMAHEFCHALYEEDRHTWARKIRGINDPDASCPESRKWWQPGGSK